MMQSKYRVLTAERLLGLTILSLATHTVSAEVFHDQHGNLAYSTAQECDQAVASGVATFYRPYTQNDPLKRDGELAVSAMRLGELPGYEHGACDRGVGAAHDRDGVADELIGKFVPYSPNMRVNAYKDASGEIIRISMQRCDNNFGADMPRPVAMPAAVSSECYADVLIPAQFEQRSETVEVEPATVRYEPVPATYKTITEQVLVTPELKKQIVIPATYKTVTETVMVTPQTIRKEPVPPTYKMVEEQVLVEPEVTRIRVEPATFKLVSDRELVKEASTRLVKVPAKYKTVTEKVKVADAHKVWKRGRAYIGKAIEVQPLRGFKLDADGYVDGNKVETDWVIADNRQLDDDVMCLVEVPAQFETIQRRVLVEPERVEEIEVPAEYQVVTRQVVDKPAHKINEVIPAEYKTVQRRVVDTPASTRDVVVPAVYEKVARTVVDQPASYREETIPAVYKTVSRQVVDRQASVREIKVPAKYQTLTHRVKVAEGRTERRQILCDTNANRPKIVEIQRALKSAGFDPGPIDGIIRSKTMSAVSAFQQANKLPVDGYLSIETVKALGVSAE